jgi:hypothetical protein
MKEFEKIKKHEMANHLDMRFHRALRKTNAAMVKTTSQKNGDNKKSNALDKIKNMA